MKQDQHLVLRLRMIGDIPPLPYVLMEWCLSKHRKNFPFLYTISSVDVEYFTSSSESRNKVGKNPHSRWHIHTEDFIFLLNMQHDVFKWTLLLLYDMYVSCHRHFFLVLLLNQRWFPPLRLQASHCSTFRIMCDVPSIAVFCGECMECFRGIVSKFFFKLLGTIPVAPIITGTIVHFRFHIRCISVHKLLYFNFFSASFSTTFLSAGIATSISVHVFSFLFLIIISGLFAVTSLCVLLDSTTLWHLPLHTLAWACVFTICCHYYYYYYYYYYSIVSAHNLASDRILYIIITLDCFSQTIISLHMPDMNLINIWKTALLNKLCWYLEVTCQQRYRLQYRLKHRYVSTAFEWRNVSHCHLVYGSVTIGELLPRYKINVTSESEVFGFCKFYIDR